jgi:hypothetical protein
MTSADPCCQRAVGAQASSRSRRRLRMARHLGERSLGAVHCSGRGPGADAEVSRLSGSIRGSLDRIWAFALNRNARVGPRS